ncbi:Uu.00g057110.m01.CDS01 [Anthostomella pinea]|uniref:Uu.00g057110.m01.CDS01 n=1 Tax=Anthostomella pinea TaxID=933095 RepID=A0AAI8YJQ9_9PEZI|nr:Uu.00g057110.m01.CDS01 [Anthostomella pinea]
MGSRQGDGKLVRQIRNYFRQDTRDFKPLKLLVSGAQGIVVMFSELNADNSEGGDSPSNGVGHGRMYRIFREKSKHSRQATLPSIRDHFVSVSSNGLDPNLGFQQILFGAEHFTRLIINEDNSALTRPNLAPIPPDDFLNTIFRVTEVVPHIQLDRFEVRASSADKTPFPSRLLWLIFRCLVRACIEMAYPPDRHRTRVFGDEWRQDPDFRAATSVVPGAEPPELCCTFVLGDGAWFNVATRPPPPLTESQATEATEFGRECVNANLKEMGTVMGSILDLKTNTKDHYDPDLVALVERCSGGSDDPPHQTLGAFMDTIDEAIRTKTKPSDSLPCLGMQRRRKRTPISSIS